MVDLKHFETPGRYIVWDLVLVGVICLILGAMLGAQGVRMEERFSEGVRLDVERIEAMKPDRSGYDSTKDADAKDRGAKAAKHLVRRVAGR